MGLHVHALHAVVACKLQGIFEAEAYALFVFQGYEDLGVLQGYAIDDLADHGVESGDFHNLILFETGNRYALEFIAPLQLPPPCVVVLHELLSVFDCGEPEVLLGIGHGDLFSHLSSPVTGMMSSRKCFGASSRNQSCQPRNCVVFGFQGVYDVLSRVGAVVHLRRLHRGGTYHGHASSQE